MRCPIIIAEACQNHQGNLSLLKDMIYAAKEAGADYIKIQSMLADELSSRPEFEEGQTDGSMVRVIKRPYQSEYNRLKPMDLDDEAHQWFVDECKKVGIKPLTTIFTFSRISFLASLDWDTVKVASYDCASFPFLKELKKKFKHLIISTGAVYDDEIKKTATLMSDHSFSFLHCVSIYPTPLDEINLRRIDYLRQFTDAVGFSDHSLVVRDGLKSTFAALYYGADIIERHFTILDKDKTRDGAVSVNAEELKQIVEFAQLNKEAQAASLRKNVPEYDIMLGTMTRKLSHIELLNRDYYRGRFVTKIGEGIRYNWEEEKS